MLASKRIDFFDQCRERPSLLAGKFSESFPERIFQRHTGCVITDLDRPLFDDFILKTDDMTPQGDRVVEIATLS